jgi:hypothetical protein
VNQSLPQFPRTVPAESFIGGQDRLVVELIAGARPSILVTWPSRPSTMSLPQWGNFLSRTFRCLANADVELRLARCERVRPRTTKARTSDHGHASRVSGSLRHARRSDRPAPRYLRRAGARDHVERSFLGCALLVHHCV